MHLSDHVGVSKPEYSFVLITVEKPLISPINKTISLVRLGGESLTFLRLNLIIEIN